MQVSQRSSLLVDAAEAAGLLGVSRMTFLRLDRRGLLGPKSVRLGRLVRWHRQQIEQWAAAGCPPRVQWLRANGLAHGTDSDSGKSGISRSLRASAGGRARRLPIALPRPTGAPTREGKA